MGGAKLINYMKEQLEQKRESYNMAIRNERIADKIRKKRVLIVEQADLNQKVEEMEAVASQLHQQLWGGQLPVQSLLALMNGLRKLGRDQLNSPTLLRFLTQLTSTLLSSQPSPESSQLLHMARQCLHSFLSSEDKVVAPWLASFQMICGSVVMRELYYNISLLQHWEDPELKQRYADMLLDILQKDGMVVQRGLQEMDGFLESGPLKEATYLRLIDLTCKELDSCEEVPIEQTQELVHIMPLMLKTYNIVTHVVNEGKSITDAIIGQLKYHSHHSSTDHSKRHMLDALDSLACILRWQDTGKRLFQRYELLPLILAKKLDTIDSQVLQRMATMFSEAVRYKYFCEVVVKGSLLDQLVGIAFSQNKLSQTIKSKFKAMLLDLAVDATSWDKNFTVRNNISAIIIEVIRQNQDIELVIKALECLRLIFKQEHNHYLEDEAEFQEPYVSPLKRQLLSRYNIAVHLERLCTHPNSTVSELSERLLRQDFDKTDHKQQW